MIKSLVLFFIPLLILMFSCSTESKLNRIYRGKSESFLFSRLGTPINTQALQDGQKIETYQKRTNLDKVQINTGQFRYDDFDSPKTTKTETFIFKINRSGVIEDVSYDCIYER